MSDPPSYSDVGDDKAEPDRVSTASTPGWMKVVGISVIVVVVLVVILLITGGGLGGHGPNMHN